ncbi:MAG TPA: hypothetical protein VKA25_13610 [Gemmatimonadales bacterium]|nr:hypothetical protein [Gemmatimonadales bacterium]
MSVLPGNGRQKAAGGLRSLTLRLRILSLLATFVAVPAKADAQGGPPLVTDDPGTPGAGRWELNVAVTAEQDTRESIYQVPLIDLNYGVGDRIQLKVELPFQIVAPAELPTLSGLGNTLLGVKWRFHEGPALAISTYPQLEFNNPTSSVARGVAEAGKRLFLPLELTRSWHDFGINVEAGYQMVEDAEDGWSYGLAAGYRFHKLDLLGECTTSSTRDFTATGVLCSLGGRYGVSKILTALVAIGHRVAGSNTQQPSLRAYVGLQWRWLASIQ